MPIRFRCGKCNQLLGISRRKAGTVVRCPTCATEVVVPNPEAGSLPGPEDEQAPATAGAQPLFEGSDFDKLFEAAADPRSRPVVAAAPPATAAAGPPADFAFDVEPVHVGGAVPVGPVPAHRSQGIMLTPGKATLLVVVVIILLALAFGMGLGLGYFLFRGTTPPPSEGESALHTR